MCVMISWHDDHTILTKRFEPYKVILPLKQMDDTWNVVIAYTKRKLLYPRFDKFYDAFVNLYKSIFSYLLFKKFQTAFGS